MFYLKLSWAYIDKTKLQLIINIFNYLMINYFKLACFSTTIQIIIGAAGGHKKEWS